MWLSQHCYRNIITTPLKLLRCCVVGLLLKKKVVVYCLTITFPNILSRTHRVRCLLAYLVISKRFMWRYVTALNFVASRTCIEREMGFAIRFISRMHPHSRVFVHFIDGNYRDRLRICTRCTWRRCGWCLGWWLVVGNLFWRDLTIRRALVVGVLI